MNTKPMNKAQAGGAQVEQHTPGPWQYSGIMNGNVIAIHQDKPGFGTKALNRGVEMLAEITLTHVGVYAVREHEEGIANARLIAAAPELLEVVSELIEPQNDEWYCEHCDSHAPKHSGGPLDGKLTGEKLTHREGCPVLKARAAIAKAEGKL